MDTIEEKKEEEKKAVETTAPTIEELQKKLDELTRHATNKEQEAARVQKKVEAFEKAEAERKTAEMTEMEKLTAKLNEAEAKRIEAEEKLIAKNEETLILTEANKPQFGVSKLKFAEPELVPLLLTPEMKVKGITEALQELAKNHPSLLDKPAASGDGVGSPKKGKAVAPADIEAEALNKKRREYSGL
jgi:hypothetical protein